MLAKYLVFERKLLSIEFDPAAHARYIELSEKAQAGELSPAEHLELDDLLTANDMLTLLQGIRRR